MPAYSTLFERLGGGDTIRVVIDEFYKRLIADDRLEVFFQDVKLSNLKMHQLEFMRLAFTEIPKDVNVSEMMLKNHGRLFREKGLNETHFDMVAEHFVGALEHFKVDNVLIQEAVAIVATLRPIFEQGAKEMGGSKMIESPEKENAKALEPMSAKDGHASTLFARLGGAKAVKAVVEEMYTRLLDDELTASFFGEMSMTHLKKHQVDFMKIAFTQIPKDLDVPALLQEKHFRLFLSKGLNETHFDRVAEHFVGSLKHLGVGQTLVDEAVSVIVPLRVVFEEGAKQAKEQY